MAKCTCKDALKWVQAIIGLAVIGLGVWNFIFGYRHFQAFVLNAYFIFFGLLLILTGLVARAASLLRWFGFLKNWFGVGAYMVWLGCLCIRNITNFQRVDTYVGLTCIVTGFICILVHLIRGGNASGALENRKTAVRGRGGV
jgi:hypothetical protein